MDELQLRRHWQEASIISKMKHSNVVQIYDLIEADGTLYSVIEYVDGPTLAEFTAGRPQRQPRPPSLCACSPRRCTRSTKRGFYIGT